MPQPNETDATFTTKKCPYCESYLAVDDRYCFSCNKKVGRLNETTGMAKHPVAWLSYIICFLSWSFLIFYIWWAFY